ncbi:MAG: peptide synthetase XpsB, partial [Gallionellaceae bacterium]
AIWQELLGVERVGRHDHFFELGGHSLLTITLIERLRQVKLNADVRTIFNTPSLSAMAAAMAGTVQAQPALVPPNLIEAGTTVITPEMLPLVALDQTHIDQIISSVPGGVANIQDIYPLAPLQEGILFQHLLKTQGDTYLILSILAFDGRERLDKFLGALQQVINRHDILRSSIHWSGLTQPVQVVHRHAVLPVETLVLEHGADALDQLQRRTDPRTTRLDLQRAPLLAAYIAEDPQSGEWYLSLLNHHIVSDHMTLEFIVAEIELILNGRPDALPPSLPYRNFIAQTLTVTPEEHAAYFRQQLGDIDEPTVPFGILNVQVDSSQIQEAHFSLEGQLARRIRDMARTHGMTAAVLFHAAWAQVISQCSGRDDVVFGTVLSGRLQGSDGADKVLGMFINTLPVRVSLGQRTVGQVVRETHQHLIDLLPHEQASLALAQRCSGVSAHLPLFTSLLNYRHSGTASSGNDEEQNVAWKGMRVIGGQERTNYPITLSVDDLGDGFMLTTQCVPEVDPHRMNSYLNTALETLIKSLEEDPGQHIRTLSVIPDTERQYLLVGLNDTAVEYPQEQLIH